MTEVTVLYRVHVDWGVAEIVGAFRGVQNPVTGEFESAREHASARAALVNGGALLEWKAVERNPAEFMPYSGWEAEGADGWTYVMVKVPVEPIPPPPTRGHRRPMPDLSG